MILQGLTEKEVEIVSELLNSEAIAFEVLKDQTIIEHNRLSLQNDLRHLTPPTLTTGILSIVFDDSLIDEMSKSLKSKLMDQGFYVDSPEQFFAHNLELSSKSKPRKARQPEFNLNQILIFLFCIVVLLLFFLIF